MKLLILIVCAVLKSSFAIPDEKLSDVIDGVSQFQKIFPEYESIPDVRTFKHKSSKVIENGKINSVIADKTEYFFLTDSEGNVMIIDAISYEEVASYYLPEISSSNFAVVNDTFYNIDTRSGTILSTDVGNILAGPANINWAHVGSFSSALYSIRTNPVVNGTLIHFLTGSGNLYSYDTISKLTAKMGKIDSDGIYASMVIVNNILYIYQYTKFWTFDGTTISSIKTPELRVYSGLFQMGNNVCIVGGNITDTYPDPVICYNPQNGEWSTPNFINEARWFPAVVSTEFNTYIFGGQSEFAITNITGVWRDSIEVLNHETNIWSFAPTPLTEGQEFIQALLFYF